MYSYVDSGDSNYCYLYLNGDQLDETQHKTYTSSGQVGSTGGRVVTLEAIGGDQIEIKTTRMDRSYWQIIFCGEYIPKM